MLTVDDREPFEYRFNSLKAEFDTWRPTFQDISSYIDPSLGFFEGSQPNKGDKLNHKILLDDTPVKANLALAAGFKSGLTPQTLPWFKLKVSDPDLNQYQPVKEWLNTVKERILEVCSKSNIYNVFHSMYMELGSFAVAAALIQEDKDDVIRGRAFTVGEYFLGTGADLRVNSFARIIWMTAIQMVEAFGIDNVSNAVKESYQQNKNTEVWFQVYHLIEPNDKRIQGRKDFKNMAHRSIYWDPTQTGNNVLRIHGYRSFPVIAPRWKTIGSNIYSKSSPGWQALGNSKSLQIMNKEQLIALQKHTNPPLQAHSSLRNYGANVLPGGINYYDTQTPDSGVRPAYEIPYPEKIDYSIAVKQNQIKESFFNHLFMVAIGNNQQETAFEMAKKWEEKLTQLGPVVENLESEMLDDAVERIYDIMLTARLFPEPPQELQGQVLNIEYVSQLAMAQKLAAANSIQQVAQFLGGLAAAWPEVLDKFDADEAADLYAEIIGAPPAIIKSDEAAAKIRQARAQQQAAMQKAQMAMTAIEGAKGLSQADMSKPNALTQMIGGQSQ